MPRSKRAARESQESISDEKKRSQDNLTPFLLRKPFLFPFEQGKDKE